MNFDYDVVIIGGAFSGAATALMLKRKRQEARVLIIEKKAAFDRKVGESTTEVSSCYMTRIASRSARATRAGCPDFKWTARNSIRTCSIAQ